MKTYCIDMDVTFSARMYVEARDIESAKKLAEKRMNADPYYHTRMGAHVSTKVTDAWEEGEDN
jgi:hypothetical protein